MDAKYEQIEKLLTNPKTDPKLNEEIIALLSEWAELKVSNDLLRAELENLEDILEDHTSEDYIVFPNDFFQYEKSNAREMTNREITKMINELNEVHEAEKVNPKTEFYNTIFTQQGNTLIVKCFHEKEEEQLIFVCKDYYELSIVDE